MGHVTDLENAAMEACVASGDNIEHLVRALLAQIPRPAKLSPKSVIGNAFVAWDAYDQCLYKRAVKCACFSLMAKLTTDFISADMSAAAKGTRKERLSRSQYWNLNQPKAACKVQKWLKDYTAGKDPANLVKKKK